MANAQQPHFNIFSKIMDQDVIEDTKKIIRGYFTGDTGKMAGSNFTTQSLSNANKNYYYNLQYSTQNQLSVAYGHSGGSGSTGTNGTLPSTMKGETEAVYRQFLNRVTSQHQPPDGGNSLNLKGFIFTGSIGSDAKADHNLYFMLADQSRMYDGIEEGTWTLHLSGSGAGKSGSFGTDQGGTGSLQKANGSLILDGQKLIGGASADRLSNLDITIGSVTFTIMDGSAVSMSLFDNSST